MMKKTFTLVAVFMIMLFSKSLPAQTATGFDSLACKEWKVAAYEQDGIKYPASPDPKGDIMILYANHKMQFTEDTHSRTGVWKYDADTKILSVTDDQNKQEVKSKVISLTNEEFVLENEDGSGKLMKTYMYLVPDEMK